ncbi:MAG: GNAT family acetyltransferase [Burkholderiaceae bacterium]|jgi:ribosomal protein S18 acetylase RimI-like enzyme
MQIRPFTKSDTESVVALWIECGLVRPWNDPYRDIERKLGEQPELFLVGVLKQQLVASAMVGYDGHRGWLYYLAVAPAARHQAVGRQLVEKAEALLTARGCPKLNLMIRTTNTDVIAFYRKLGYIEDQVVCLGRRLIPDAP